VKKLKNKSTPKSIPYDVLVVEKYRTDMLPLIIHCLGFGMPVLVLDEDLDEEAITHAPSCIATNSSNLEEIRNVITNMISRPEALENDIAKSRAYVASQNSWENFKRQAAAFYQCAFDQPVEPSRADCLDLLEQR
jgi:hypothetical protein